MRLFSPGSRPRAWHALLAAVLVSVGAQAQARCTLRMTELPIKMVGQRAIATVGINGTEVPLLVDTGAFFSMLPESTAAQLNLPLERLPFGMQISGFAGDVQEPRMTRVKKMKLLDGDLADMEFIVGGNEIDSTAMGILGRNILAALDVEYDLAHGAIRFVVPSADCDDANMAYWAGDAPVSEIKLIRNRDRDRRDTSLRTYAKINGHEVTALFDTGASTVVSLHGAYRADVKDADMTPLGESWGVGVGKVKSWSAGFDSVQIGGETVRHNHLEVDDFVAEDEDMLVGIDFFLSHHLYVSKKQSKMFATYNGGAVFSMNKSEPPTPSASAAGKADAADTLTADQHARRGAASLARGDLAAALVDLDRACALAPGNASFLGLRGQIRLRLEDAQGLADLDTALQLEPGLADVRRQRALLRVAAGQDEPALADLAILDQTLPAQSNLRAELGALYGSLHRPAQAVAQWSLWIAAHPHDIRLGEAYNSRCWDRTALGADLEKASDDCDAAVDADPKNAQYRDSRGWAWLRMGKLKKARDSFDRALALEPKLAFSLYGRGLVHLGLGEAAAAQADLTAARTASATIDQDVRASGMPVAPDAPDAPAAAPKAATAAKAP